MNPSDLPLKLPSGQLPLLSIDKAKAHAKAVGAQRLGDVNILIDTIYNEIAPLGYNPDVLVALSNLETGYWKSDAWVKHLNAGGIGITDNLDHEIHFDSAIQSARALAVHYMAYVDGVNNAMAGWLFRDPRYLNVLQAGYAKSVKTVAGLGSGKWATDTKYKYKVVARLEEMLA